MRILVADDEPEMTMVLEALLKREHYSVDAVHNGQDALDYGLAENYDCIILDIMMPKRNGIQVLQALRKKNIATPVLLLTAKSQVEDRVEGLDSGADNLERQRQFVTDASHELKTPLAILSVDMGLLADTYEEDKWLESAKSQIARLDRLIRNLVELAHTEEAAAENTAEMFSVSEIARASADAFLPLAEADGKSLTADIAGSISLKGVPDNFFRLFSILLDNAVKYCDPGGTIHLSVTPRGRSLCISISNPCAGVDPAQLGRYFDRFYRADSSRARSTGGYGIGLSTAKAIVTRHRGRISNRYADGVITFTAVIPQTG